MATDAIAHPLPVRTQLVSVAGNRVAKNESFYRPELDLLRFLAFLCVFFHHSLPTFDPSRHTGKALLLLGTLRTAKEAGGFGVCLFFVLSAYLITELLERERARVGSVHIGRFYVRRILRIWPLYFTFLFLMALFGLIFPRYQIEGRRLLAFIFLSGNWYTAAAGCGANPIAPLWSISVEEQFYLVWPWIAKLGGRISIVRVSLTLIPLSWLALSWLAFRGRAINLTSWVNSFVQFQFFSVGALLSLLLKRRTPTLATAIRVGLILTGMVLWSLAEAVFRIKDDSLPLSPISSILGYGFVTAGCVMLFVGFLGLSARMIPQKLAYLGKISYGLYVFHMLAIHSMWAWALHGVNSLGSWGLLWGTARLLTVVTVALAITIALAVTSYKFLERPFLNIKRRFAFIESRAL